MKVKRVPQVMERYQVKSRVTLDAWEREGLLPPRVRIGKNTIGWIESELDEFDRKRPRGIAAEAAPAESVQ